MRALLFFTVALFSFTEALAADPAPQESNADSIIAIAPQKDGPAPNVMPVAPQQDSPPPNPSPNTLPEPKADQSETKPQEKSFIKNIFTTSTPKPASQKNQEGSSRPAPVNVTFVDIDQLQKVIDSLPEEDRRTISAIRVQIATWPKEVFDEISAYREFVISSRKVAKQKYALLSQEAKSALETERQLKIKLSPQTAQILESLEVKANRGSHE
jgi:hypothetical protein